MLDGYWSMSYNVGCRSFSSSLASHVAAQEAAPRGPFPRTSRAPERQIRCQPETCGTRPNRVRQAATCNGSIVCRAACRPTNRPGSYPGGPWLRASDDAPPPLRLDHPHHPNPTSVLEMSRLAIIHASSRSLFPQPYCPAIPAVGRIGMAERIRAVDSDKGTPIHASKPRVYSR